MRFYVSVVDEGNHTVAMTAYGRRMNGIPEGGGLMLGGSAIPVKLAPGKSVWEELLLDKEYEMNHTGTYRIQAEQYDPLIKVPVKSNVIVLTVQ